MRDLPEGAFRGTQFYDSDSHFQLGYIAKIEPFCYRPNGNYYRDANKCFYYKNSFQPSVSNFQVII